MCTVVLDVYFPLLFDSLVAEFAVEFVLKLEQSRVGDFGVISR